MGGTRMIIHFFFSCGWWWCNTKKKWNGRVKRKGTKKTKTSFGGGGGGDRDRIFILFENARSGHRTNVKYKVTFFFKNPKENCFPPPPQYEKCVCVNIGFVFCLLPIRVIRKMATAFFIFIIKTGPTLFCFVFFLFTTNVFSLGMLFSIIYIHNHLTQLHHLRDPASSSHDIVCVSFIVKHFRVGDFFFFSKTFFWNSIAQAPRILETINHSMVGGIYEI